MGFCETSMSDRPEGVLVRMLRWVDSGVGRLLERTGRTEQQVDKTQLAIGRIIEQLNRIEKRLEDIERRLPPRAAIEFFRRLSRRLIVTGFCSDTNAVPIRPRDDL